MESERKLNDKIVSQLTDYEAKRYPEWVTSWLDELLTMYQQMPDKNLLAGYEKTIEPLISWLTPESRRWLGEALWQNRREWLADHSAEGFYPFTGLASYLSPPVGGS